MQTERVSIVISGGWREERGLERPCEDAHTTMQHAIYISYLPPPEVTESLS